jgi:hypothetical protein
MKRPPANRAVASGSAPAATCSTTLDIVQQYHADLAQRLADEAAQIARRAILKCLHERENRSQNVLDF